MNYLTEILLEVLDLYILYKFMYVFFDTRSVNRYIEAGAYFFKFAVLEIVKQIAFYPLVNLSATVICIFLITLCYESTISKKILVTLIINTNRVLAEGIGAVVIGITKFNILEKSISIDIFTTLLIQIIIWFMVLIMGILKNMRLKIHIPKRFLIVSSSVQILSVIAIAFIFSQNTFDVRASALSLWMVVISNVLIIYLYDLLLKVLDEKMRIENIKREKEYYHNQLELLQTNQKNLQQFRHDIRNRLYAIEQMLKQKKYQKAEQYIGQIVGKLHNTKIYSQTGNIIVDSIINYKLTEAEKQKVEVHFDIIFPENINIPEDDIIIVIGNLLDNAIEAVKDAKDKKELEVHIEYDKGFIFIHMKNTYYHNVKEKGGRLITNKLDKEMHGIGLQSVDAVIKKYDGIKNIDYSNSEFLVDVILPIIQIV